MPKLERIPVVGGVILKATPTVWIAQCHSCKEFGLPKRMSQRTLPSEDAAREWFKTHLAPQSRHWEFRYPNAKTLSAQERREREDAILRSIFDKALGADRDASDAVEP